MNLRLRILKIAVIENCMGRVINVPETRQRSWCFVQRAPEVEKRASNITLPLPLTKTSKEARKAVFEASTCHVWVTNRLVIPTENFVGRAKKIHYRPNDILAIHDIEHIGIRLFYQTEIMSRYGFSEGVKRVMISKRCIDHAQRHPQGFIDALHGFPSLEEVWLVVRLYGYSNWHLNIFEPFIEDLHSPHEQDSRALGRLDLNKLRERRGREPLKVELLSLHKYFGQTVDEERDLTNY